MSVFRSTQRRKRHKNVEFLSAGIFVVQMSSFVFCASAFQFTVHFVVKMHFESLTAWHSMSMVEALISSFMSIDNAYY